MRTEMCPGADERGCAHGEGSSVGHAGCRAESLHQSPVVTWALSSLVTRVAQG